MLPDYLCYIKPSLFFKGKKKTKKKHTISKSIAIPNIYIRNDTEETILTESKCIILNVK